MPSALRQVADQMFSRASGARLYAGNRIRLLKDAAENYPAWLDAIHAARRTRGSCLPMRSSTYNPPRLDTPFGWVSRDHRKVIAGPFWRPASACSASRCCANAVTAVGCAGRRLAQHGHDVA
jgi:hypothetical protein